MYTIEQLATIAGLSVIGAGIITWCCKMQWDQNALGKLIRSWKSESVENNKKTNALETKIQVMEGKYDFMCELVMDDVKKRRADLWQHHSPLMPTADARALIPDDIMDAIKDYDGPGEHCITKALYVLEKVTIQRISEVAREKNLSLLEFVALIGDIKG